MEYYLKKCSPVQIRHARVRAGQYRGAGNVGITFPPSPIALLGLAPARSTVVDCELASHGMVLEGQSNDTLVQGEALRHDTTS